MEHARLRRKQGHDEARSRLAMRLRRFPLRLVLFGDHTGHDGAILGIVQIRQSTHRTVFWSLVRSLQVLEEPVTVLTVQIAMSLVTFVSFTGALQMVRQFDFLRVQLIDVEYGLCVTAAAINHYLIVVQLGLPITLLEFGLQLRLL